jgi:hypothetical protein
MPHATPILVSEAQFARICATANWLPPPDRQPFLLAVVRALDGEVDEGSLARAIRVAFRAYFRPPEIPHEPQQLKKIDYRGGREEAIEANRQLRSRRWTE